MLKRKDSLVSETNILVINNIYSNWAVPAAQ